MERNTEERNSVKIEIFKQHRNSFIRPKGKLNENLAELITSKNYLKTPQKKQEDEDVEMLSPYVRRANSGRSFSSSEESDSNFDRHNDDAHSIDNFMSPLIRTRHDETHLSQDFRNNLHGQGNKDQRRASRYKDTKYSPSTLRRLFDMKVKEIMPHLNKESSTKSENMRYFLELLCKEFLYLLILEKPTNILMSTMNLLNFDKAVIDLVKHYKVKEEEKEILALQKSVTQNCQNLLEAVADVDKRRDPTLSPNTQKFVTSNPLADFKSVNAMHVRQSEGNLVKESPNEKSLLDVANNSIIEAQKRIEKLLEKNDKLEEAVRSMRYGFLKELQAYKDQLFRLEKYPDTFEPINVQYFSGLEILDDRTRELLDKRISYITDDYNFKLLRLQKHNMSLEDTIKKWEKICKGQNVGVTIHELNPDDIVHKLSIVESEAQPIWEAFNKHYGAGFFNKMIEKEFGINPDTHEEIGNRFGLEVNNIRITANEKFDKLSQEAKKQIDTLKARLKNHQVDALYARETVEDELKKAKEEIMKMCEEHFLQMRAADFKKYDEEKSELYAIIRQLEQQVADAKVVKPPPKRVNHEAEQFKNFLKEAKGEKDDEEEVKKPEVEEVKEEVDRSNWPLLSQSIIDTLREEKVQLEKEMLNYKYLASVGEKDYKRINDKYKILVNDISFLKESNDKLRVENDNFENQLAALQSSNRESASYISVLESDNDALKHQIKRLTAVMPPNRLALIEKQSPLSIINMQTHKAQHQINSNYFSTQTHILRENTVNQATLTNI